MQHRPQRYGEEEPMRMLRNGRYAQTRREQIVPHRTTERRWCPNQSRVFNYARHRSPLRLRNDLLDEKENMSRKPIPFFRVSIDRADSEVSVIGLRERIIIRVKWRFSSGLFRVSTSLRAQKLQSSFTRFYVTSLGINQIKFNLIYE